MTDKHTVGLDVGTGAVLWENGKDWTLRGDGFLDQNEETGARPHNPTGTVVLVRPAPDAVGIDARTGAKRWSVSEAELFEDGCAPKSPTRSTVPESAVDIGVATCTVGDNVGGAGEDLTVAVNPANGALAWSSKSLEPSSVLSRGGVTLTRKPGTARPRLVSNAGRVLFTGRPGTSCRLSTCQLFATGGRIVFAYQADHYRDRLALIDPRRGAVKTIANLNANTYAAAGGRLYASGGSLADDDSGSVLPDLLSVVDVRTGHVTKAPGPYASPDAYGPGADGSRTSVLGAAGGSLVTKDLVRTRKAKKKKKVFDAVRVRGYSSAGADAPVALGGVQPADWPSPCPLLRGIRSPDRYGGEPISVGGRSVRTHCNAGDVQLSELAVLWTAKTEREAADLFGSGRRNFGADQARTMVDGSTSRRMLRVGRVVVLLTTYTWSCRPRGKCDDLDTLARTTVKNLRAQGY